MYIEKYQFVQEDYYKKLHNPSLTNTRRKDKLFLMVLDEMVRQYPKKNIPLLNKHIFRRGLSQYAPFDKIL